MEDLRYEPCKVLLDAGISCKIWGDDAMPWCGFPSIGSDVFILVRDTKQASEILKSQGFVPTAPNPRFKCTPELNLDVPRLVPTALANVALGKSLLSYSDETGLLQADDRVLRGVLLLPAADWNYTLPESLDGFHQLHPYLHEFFDSVVEKWMDLGEESDGLRGYIGSILIYRAAYMDEFWTEDFESKVRKEHHQLLFDLLAGGVVGRSDLEQRSCQLHHRNIRDRILQGLHEPSLPAGFIRKRAEPFDHGI